MSFQSGPQHWKLLVSLQSSEASGCFLHGGRGPAHRHRGRAPSLHVPAYAPHRAHGILDDVGTGERALQLLRQSKPRDGEDFVDAFQGDPPNLRPGRGDPTLSAPKLVATRSEPRHAATSAIAP